MKLGKRKFRLDTAEQNFKEVAMLTYGLLGSLNIKFFKINALHRQRFMIKLRAMLEIMFFEVCKMVICEKS